MAKESTKLNSEYLFNRDDFQVTPKMKQSFDKYGYILVRGLLDNEEVEKVKKVFENATSEQILEDNKMRVSDGQGREAKLIVWSHPGNDVSGMVSRSQKVAGTCEKLMGEEVYHYHGKLVSKEAFTGGSHLWHQDYGYWYKNGCLLPNMMTVFIALDKCTKGNGCLQILEGSHTCGRLDHELMHGQQAIPDIKRVEQIKERCPLVWCEMNPGDALFFHSNMMHTSGQNSSPNRRWALLTAFNTKSNNPTKEHHHPCYTPLTKVPDAAIKECENYSLDLSQMGFVHPSQSQTSRPSLTKEQQEAATRS
ncbi:L-proline trans-4-hydroxylase-like [Mytilus galloprovincialis]|uniref:L-proline trans-4-hydroxylase-like n=1 Tax=Mytilus galloprovincialis TaxID=29158 RepID=UPI003F7B945A